MNHIQFEAVETRINQIISDQLISIENMKAKPRIDINESEFTETGAIKISEKQLLFIETLIIDFHDNKENEKHQEQARIYLMEDDPYDESYLNTENL